MGILRGTLGKTEQILERTSVDNCCIQENRFIGFREKSARTIGRTDKVRSNFLDQEMGRQSH